MVGLSMKDQFVSSNSHQFDEITAGEETSSNWNDLPLLIGVRRSFGSDILHLFVGSLRQRLAGKIVLRDNFRLHLVVRDSPAVINYNARSRHMIGISGLRFLPVISINPNHSIF